MHVDPDFASEERCRSCHELGEPPLSNLERPIEDTYAEWEAWKVATGRSESCADCHMPAVERPIALGGPVRRGRTHTFHGAWDDAMVRAAVDIRVEAGAVVLTNRAGTCYRVVPARSRAAAEALVGDYQGVLVSDCLNIDDALTPHQHKCYAHHLKEIDKALQDPMVRASPYLRELRALLCGAMALKAEMACLPPAAVARRRRGKRSTSME